MHVMEREPPGLPAYEAQENLRVIRTVMERSTRYSTFSGPSGILAGSLAVLGTILHALLTPGISSAARPYTILAIWCVVIALAITGDYLLTKRKARLYGKHIRSHLGKQIAAASAPGLGSGAILTLFLLSIGRLEDVFPFWMLSYGTAVSAVGLFSQVEVRRLGGAFLLAGFVTAVFRLLVPDVWWTLAALTMMGLSFGGFHIIYGFAVTGKDDRFTSR